MLAKLLAGALLCAGVRSQSSFDSGRQLYRRADPPASGWTLQSACLTDNSTHILTTSATTNALTVNACTAWCSSQSLIYSGVANGNQCWCGNTINPKGGGVVLPSTSCRTPCTGDNTSLCGGTNAITLYNYTIPYVPFPAGWSLVSNCVSDSTTRLLATQLPNIAYNTPSRCVTSCNNQGFTYAGIEYGSECWCGNTLNTSGGAGGASNACTVTCPGNSSDTCGGGYALKLYKKSNISSSSVAPSSTTLLTVSSTLSSSTASSTSISSGSMSSSLVSTGTSTTSAGSTSATSSSLSSLTLGSSSTSGSATSTSGSTSTSPTSGSATSTSGSTSTSPTSGSATSTSGSTSTSPTSGSATSTSSSTSTSPTSGSATSTSGSTSTSPTSGSATSTSGSTSTSPTSDSTSTSGSTSSASDLASATLSSTTPVSSSTTIVTGSASTTSSVASSSITSALSTTTSSASSSSASTDNGSIIMSSSISSTSVSSSPSSASTTSSSKTSASSASTSASISSTLSTSSATLTSTSSTLSSSSSTVTTSATSTSSPSSSLANSSSASLSTAPSSAASSKTSSISTTVSSNSSTTSSSSAPSTTGSPTSTTVSNTSKTSSTTSASTSAFPTGHYALGVNSSYGLPSVAVRYEINNFIGMKYHWSLFVQAIIAMQAIYSGPDASLGHYAMSAIHAEPFISWNGSYTTARANAGYCAHGIPIFPTWHRPYTAMYEQIMRAQAIKIASTYSVDAANFQAAAQVIRFPYWDWAINASPPDELISLSKLSITGANGNTISVTNPFLSFSFQGKQSALDSNWNKQSATTRYPSSSNPVSDMKANLKSLQQQNLQHVQQMFQYVNTWPWFSNHNADSANSDKSNSLESIHDSIHVTLGGGGHFGDPAVAGFDPMFFFHHANVDRMIALWQAFYPSVWVTNGVTASNMQTRFLATGDAISSSTPLAPFWSSQTNYWTSDSSRSISAFQYTYPEFVGTSSNADVIARVQKLYGFSGSGTPQRRALAAQKKTYDWTVRVRFAAGELGRPFVVHCFLGDPPSDPSQYMEASTYVGSAFAFNRANGGDSVSQSFVQLSQTLANKTIFDFILSPALILPYLTLRLQWRLVEADLATSIPLSSLPSLEVVVMAAVITPASSSSGRPSRDFPQIFHNVTKGRKGGSHQISQTITI